MKITLSNLQQVLKEYLELPDADINSVVTILKDDWSSKLAQRVPDIDAAALLEELLGVPDWTQHDAPVV